MKCRNCGKETVPGALYCTGCGGRLDNTYTDEAEAAKSVEETVSEEIGEKPLDEVAGENKQFSHIDEVEEPFPCNPVGLDSDDETVDDELNDQMSSDGTYEEESSLFGDTSFEPVTVNKTSKIEQKRIIRRLRPLGTWSFFWRDTLSLIPLVNIIVMFVFAFADGINENSRAFARAKLIRYLLILIAVVIGFVLCWIFRYQISAWLKTFIKF